MGTIYYEVEVTRGELSEYVQTTQRPSCKPYYIGRAPDHKWIGWGKYEICSRCKVKRFAVSSTTN